MSYWTDERIAELKRFWEFGLSASQIAKEMSAPSRCAIIGKARRLGLQSKNSPNARPRHATNTPRSAPRLSRLRVPRRQMQEPRFPDLSVIVSNEPNTSPEMCANRISLLEATEGHCRWPAADDGSAMMVCGDPSLTGHSWCPRHCRVAYMPMPDRRRTNKPVPFRRVAEAV